MLSASDKRVPAPRPPAHFVWSDGHGGGRNVFCLFRRSFTLSKVPPRARLHLFADTRYRLKVNGQIAGYGPARFLPAYPEFDSVELRSFLQRGRNVITVEVNSFGSSSFESVPSAGGFIAWGKVGVQVDLATPGDWKARPQQAWDPSAPPWSFAQSPVEILELDKLPAALFLPAFDDSTWSRPVLHLRQDNWGTLRPRSIPPLDLTVKAFARVIHLAELANDELRFGFRCDAGSNQLRQNRHRLAFATCLWSPRKQTVNLAAFWGPNYLNGRLLKAEKPAAKGNRLNHSARFRRGWNLFYGEPEVLQESWGVLLGLPKSSGIIPHSSPRRHSTGIIRFTQPMPVTALKRCRRRVPRNFEELPHFPSGWQTSSGKTGNGLPARDMGWDRAARKLPVPQVTWPLRVVGSEGADVAITLDYGEEFIGHIMVDVETERGALLDVAFDEVLDEQGLIPLFRDQHAINVAERYVLPGGRVQFEGFHPRGGRYVQLTLRGAGMGAILRNVALRRTLSHIERTGHFECSDKLLTWGWLVGAHTIEASTEDAFVDPWRERGLYVGDALVEHHAARALTADVSMTRRCLWLWGKGQRPDGQICDVVPSWRTESLADYSLIWVILLHDYWAGSGDRGLISELWPHVQRVFESPLWLEAESGLWISDHLKLFIDWAASDSSVRSGENGVLNALRFRAHECAATLAHSLGLPKEARGHRRQAGRVRRAFQTLWDERSHRYAACRLRGRLSAHPSLHTNVLALAFRLAPATKASGLLRHVRAVLARNHLLPRDRVELYFLYFALDALFARGCSADAENIMRAHLHPQYAAGAWSLWEALGRGLAQKGSQCHGWSAWSTHYLSTRTLGVRYSQANQADAVLIAPDSETLDWARGTVPHPKGAIRVEWSVHGDTFHLRVQAPKSIDVSVVPQGRLARMSSDIKVSQS